MISSEAPLLFSKACEIFIRELTLRAWLHTEDSKRRTQQVCWCSGALKVTASFSQLVETSVHTRFYSCMFSCVDHLGKYYCCQRPNRKLDQQIKCCIVDPSFLSVVFDYIYSTIDLYSQSINVGFDIIFFFAQ